MHFHRVTPWHMAKPPAPSHRFHGEEFLGDSLTFILAPCSQVPASSSSASSIFCRALCSREHYSASPGFRHIRREQLLANRCVCMQDWNPSQVPRIRNRSLHVSLRILINLTTKVRLQCYLTRDPCSQIQTQKVTGVFNSGEKSYFGFEMGHCETWWEEQA